MVGGVIYSPSARAAPSWRSMPQPARCCGRTAKTKAHAAKPLRAGCRAAGSPIGATARIRAILYVTPGYRLIALDAKTGRMRPAASAPTAWSI